MDADDTSGNSDSICSDDTEYLLGQNVSIREIDDEDEDNHQTHENSKVPSPISRSYRSSPQHSPQKLQQINSANLRSPSRKGVKVKAGKGQDDLQRSPGHSASKRSSAMETSTRKVTAKADRKSRTQQNYTVEGISRGQSQTVQSSYGTETVRYNQNVERLSKSKKHVSDSYTKHPHGQGKFQSPENHKSVHAHHKTTGSPKLKSDLRYDPSQLTPPSRDKVNTKRKHIEPGRSPVRESAMHANQNNWEIDSEISVDMVNGGHNSVDIDSNDLESEMSEATEDLIAGQDEDDEDFTEKLKELNLAVNFDAGTNGEYYTCIQLYVASIDKNRAPLKGKGLDQALLILTYTTGLLREE